MLPKAPIFIGRKYSFKSSSDRPSVQWDWLAQAVLKRLTQTLGWAGSNSALGSDRIGSALSRDATSQRRSNCGVHHSREPQQTVGFSTGPQPHSLPRGPPLFMFVCSVALTISSMRSRRRLARGGGDGGCATCQRGGVLPPYPLPPGYGWWESGQMPTDRGCEPPLYKWRVETVFSMVKWYQFLTHTQHRAYKGPHD